MKHSLITLFVFCSLFTLTGCTKNVPLGRRITVAEGGKQTFDFSVKTK